ncbi:MAG: DUF6261 family protein, partial [Bacteroidales bacterium]|nr:DUF6261 family protein [Bacteroidales bacterium]
EGWIRELDSSLNNFKNLLRLRNESVAVALPKENLKTIRKEIDGVYNKMITRINAAAELDETGTYEPFIQQINAEILYFNEHTHRKARKDLGKGDHTVIEPIPVQQHTGMPITPIPSVIYREEGKQAVTLTFAEDFTLSYKNNINVGMAEIIVRGKGHYKGKIITTFNIEFEN